MMPITKIICPTDFSEASSHAVRAAGEMAAQLGAELVLMHVVAPVPVMPEFNDAPPFDVVGYERALLARAEKALNEMVASLLPKTLRVRLITSVGHAADVICRTAESERAGLVVIATHGMTGWRHYVFGSVAQKVVQHTALPVLLIRAPRPAGA